MTWLKFIFFIVVANFFVSIVNKLIGLGALELELENAAIISFPVTAYLAVKIIATLVNKFPDNYDEYKVWLWLIYVLGPVALYSYYAYRFGVEITEIVYPGWTVVLNVLQGVVVSYFVGGRLTEAKNNRLRKLSMAKDEAEFRKYAEAKAASEASAQDQAEAIAVIVAKGIAENEARTKAENKTYQSQSPTDSSQSNHDQNIDEKHYETALIEYEDDEMVQSTYIKALALNKGDEEATRWTYVQLRAANLQKEES